jgi:hypothetical protein
MEVERTVKSSPARRASIVPDTGRADNCVGFSRIVPFCFGPGIAPLLFRPNPKSLPSVVAMRVCDKLAEMNDTDSDNPTSDGQCGPNTTLNEIVTPSDHIASGPTQKSDLKRLPQQRAD